MVLQVSQKLAVSERRACKVLEQARATQRRSLSPPSDEKQLTEDIIGLASKEAFVSPIKSKKLRRETLVLTRSLMMKHSSQILSVLSKFRGYRKRAAWLRTAFCIIILVFGIALGHNTTRFLSGQGCRDSTNKG